ncbi:hypothetical protein EJF16_70341 [Clavispora lusitaniae]|nr:hypothetical protein EJF16_70341 [Clavispora lusitaniae]
MERLMFKGSLYQSLKDTLKVQSGTPDKTQKQRKARTRATINKLLKTETAHRDQTRLMGKAKELNREKKKKKKEKQVHQERAKSEKKSGKSSWRSNAGEAEKTSSMRPAN